MTQHYFKDILRTGEELYFDLFREELEKSFWGQYAVIDIDRKEYVVNQNQLAALDEAKAKFGKKLFYSIRVGNIDRPTFDRIPQHAWIF